MDQADNERSGGIDGASLLLVDDEANILSALRRLFRPAGYTVHAAQGGDAGLEILAREPVDLVISDMRMPGMDGAQFLARVAETYPDVVRILLTGYADLASTVRAVNEGRIHGYFSKPWDDDAILISVKDALETKRLRAERDRLAELTRVQNQQLRELNAGLEEKVAARTEELRQANMFLELSYQELRESYFKAVPLFANLIELRDADNAGHGRRVAELARDMARHLKLDEETRRHVWFAGLLHDVGKIGLPDEILRTPRTKMDKAQRKTYAQHPVTGQAVLSDLEPLEPTARIIRAHHESYDGSGFPDGLIGERIPLGARLLAVADDYDGLRRGTLLGERLSGRDARAFIVKRAMGRYDPRVVEAFEAVMEARGDDEDTVRERCIDALGLRAGMVLSRDLKNSEDLLLLSRGYRLTTGLIEKIRGFQKDAGRPLLIHVVSEEGEHP